MTKLHKLARHVVQADRFDQAHYAAIREEMAAFDAAHNDLRKITETGGHMMADTYFSVVKVRPQLEDPENVMPMYRVNRRVGQEMMDLNEWQKLRAQTARGDDVAAAMAAVMLEPDLETLFDRLRKEQEMADELQQKMAELAALEAEAQSLDEMEEEQERRDELAEQIEAMEAEIESLDASLNEALDEAASEIRATLRPGLTEAADDAESLNVAAKGWGLDTGTLQKMDFERRMELAKRLNNDRIREISELFGRFWNTLLTEQTRKVTWARDELHDIRLGADLPRVLPSEFLYLEDPVLELDFLRRYADRALAEYELIAQEKVSKGGIVCCRDGSGSMSGPPEQYATALSLCFMHWAKRQKRKYHGIVFGGPGEFKLHRFDEPADYTPERIIDWGENVGYFWGTDFETPLRVALGLLEEEYEQLGHTEGDILFITDGLCGLSDRFIQEFQEKQRTLGFRIFGCLIGHPRTMEPVHSLCEGRTFTLTDLRSPIDIRELLRQA